MVIHEFDIETPPEGLEVWVALSRCPQQPCCRWNAEPYGWAEPELPRRRGMPGDTIDVQLYYGFQNSPVPADHLVRLHFRESHAEDDRVADFRWTPAPPRSVPA